VNFWGGEPARTEVMSRAAKNRGHPRCFSNGPLTGFALVSRDGGDERSARGLAENMVLYEQQLCSSPTMGAFVGVTGEALDFAQVAPHLQTSRPQHESFLRRLGFCDRAPSVIAMRCMSCDQGGGATPGQSDIGGESAWRSHVVIPIYG
jgi:hypothetical protein